jgi:hypothetical protein
VYETRNDLAEGTRKAGVKLLNERLAAAIDLQLQAKQALTGTSRARTLLDCTILSIALPLRPSSMSI